MLKGNKGEWSEIYTLLKLLGDKEIYVGDENLNKIPDLLYPIIKILRDENDGHYEYSVADNLILIVGEKTDFSISIIEFKQKAELLLSKIKKAHSPSFFVPEIEDFLSQIKCSTLKAKSTSKTDIRIVIHDLKTNLQSELGFSIKSQLGKPSTLLNPGKTTNFVYSIDNCNLNNEIVNSINSTDTRSKIQDRLIKILNYSCKLNFVRNENKIFGNNLALIDSLMQNILAEILFEFYSTKETSIVGLINQVANKNPLKFDTSDRHRFYEYKIKKLLTEVALGMTPSKVWNGQYDATGGYLVVKTNGEVLSYHVYNKNKFENYLYHNTKLVTPSSRRYKFGEIYEENAKYFIKLNLQIRFKK